MPMALATSRAGRAERSHCGFRQETDDSSPTTVRSPPRRPSPFPCTKRDSVASQSVSRSGGSSRRSESLLVLIAVIFDFRNKSGHLSRVAGNLTPVEAAVREVTLQNVDHVTKIGGFIQVMGN